MKINEKKISKIIINQIKKKVRKINHQSTLAVFLFGNNKKALFSLKKLRKIIKPIGGQLKIITFKKTPPFEKLANLLRNIASNPETKGILIQKPIPASLNTESLYNFIPNKKDIEGYKEKSYFYHPLALSLLTIIKSFFSPSQKNKEIVVTKKDKSFFKSLFKRKKVVFFGQNTEKERLICRILTEFKINLLIIHDKTPSPEIFYQDADVIISSFNKKNILKELKKPSTLIINIGLRIDENKIKGDLEKEMIKKITTNYAGLDDGLLTIENVYLISNFIQALKI